MEKDFNQLIKRAKEEKQKIFVQIQEMGKEDRSTWNTDNYEKFDKLYADLESRTLEIQSYETEEKVLRMQAEEEARRNNGSQPSDDDKRYAEVVDKYMRRGLNRLNTEERAILEQRVMSEGTDSEGGYLVPTLWGDRITQRQVEMGPMLMLGDLIPSDSGASIAFPTNDDSSNEGEWLAEKSTATSQDLVIGNVDIAVHVIDSKAITVQNQLLQDNGFNLESYLSNKMGERIGRGLNTAFTTGDGSGKPYGVVTGAGVNVAAQAAAAISRTDLVSLKYGLDESYHSRGAFMVKASTMKSIVLLSIGSSDDRPLYLPSPNVGQPDMLEGNPVYLNPAMAAIGANNISALFGDFKQYIIRNVPKGRAMMRLEELYALKYQTAFILFERWGGRLVDTYGIAKLTHPAS